MFVWQSKLISQAEAGFDAIERIADALERIAKALERIADAIEMRGFK